MKAIKVLAVMMTAMVMTVSANASDETTKVNNSEKSEIVKQKVMKTQVNGHDMKFVYSTDANDRVSSKVCYQWNSTTDKWDPISSYTVIYGQEETVVSFAEWNKKTKSFTLNAKQERYDAKVYPVVISLPEQLK